MNENKTVWIRGTKYRMYQVAMTGWVFVRGRYGTHPVAHIANGEIIELEPVDALRYASNEELVQAWLEA